MGDINWYKYFKKHRPVIEVLANKIWLGSRFETTVEMETDEEIYYNDEDDRWCYFKKSEEGTAFSYVKHGEK